jgi:hypothetical protein
MASSGMLRRVALVRTDVSDELSAFFIRATRIGELETTLAVTSNRRTLLRNMRLTLCQNGVYFNGIRIYNKLPLYLKELVESPKIFNRTFKKYLVSHCFYSLDEFYDVNV